MLLVEPPTLMSPESRDVVASKPCGGKRVPRILVVEDEVDLGDVLEEILTEEFGVDVMRAYTADQALSLLRRDRQFDLIFSDVVMPGSINGVRMAKMVRTAYPSIPIVLGTGLVPERDLLEAVDFPLLQKPYYIPRLLQAFRQAGLSL